LFLVQRRAIIFKKCNFIKKGKNTLYFLASINILALIFLRNTCTHKIAIVWSSYVHWGNYIRPRLLMLHEDLLYKERWYTVPHIFLFRCKWGRKSCLELGLHVSDYYEYCNSENIWIEMNIKYSLFYTDYVVIFI
jgi:hypothetical protein